MKRSVLFLLTLALSLPATAQQLLRESLYKLGNRGSGFGSSTLTREGNVVFTGSSIITPGYQSIFTLINPNADTLWMRKGPMLSTGGIGIRQAPKSGYFFYTTQLYTSASGTILQKYDGNGILKRTMAYPISYWDLGYLLLSSPDSGYYLGGMGFLANKVTGFTLGRTDSLGNLKWQKGYDWSTNDFFSDMQHTNNSNIVMYGMTYANNVSAQRLKLLLVNQNGDSVVGRVLSVVGTPGRHERLKAAFCSVTPLSDGGFLMAAEIDTSAANSPSHLAMAVKVNANLQPVWHYINRSVPNNVTFTRSRELTDGTIVMLAYERKGSTSILGNKFFLYRFSPAGALLNVYTFTSAIATQVETPTFEALPDSSFLIGGMGILSQTPIPSIGFYIAKVKIAGLAPALPLPSATITGIKPEVAKAKVSLGQSYPNPTGSEAIIPFTLPVHFRNTNLIIRAIATGKEIKRYELGKGSNSQTVDLESLASGLYLYSLEIDGIIVATKKLSVMK